MARSVTPPPLSDRKRLLANSVRRRSEVAPLPHARSRSLEAHDASSSVSKWNQHTPGRVEMSKELNWEAKVEVKSDLDDGEVETPRRQDRTSVKVEPKPSPTSPPLPRFQTNSTSSTGHHSMTVEQPSAPLQSMPIPTLALRFQKPIVAHTNEAGTSQSLRQVLFHQTLVAEPPHKKRRYSTSGSGRASTSKRQGLVCDSDQPRDDDGNPLVLGKSYFVGCSRHGAAEESESATRRSPRKAKPVEIFSSLHMMGPTRRRRKVPKVATDLTASQVSHQYNDRVDEQVNVFNNAWNPRFAEPNIDVQSLGLSSTNGKGKKRASSRSPLVGPEGLKHVLNKVYQADNAIQPVNTPWYFDTGTLKWVRRDAVLPGATRVATDPPAATSSSIPALPSPATTPVPKPSPLKRGPGRPRKSSLNNSAQPSPPKPQSRRMSTGRPRGRPRKNPESQTGSTRKSTGRPRGRPRKHADATTAHASGSGHMPDYRLHQFGPGIPPFLVLHEPSIFSASASQYSLPSASSSHASSLSTFPSTSFEPSPFVSASQTVYPVQTQQAYASLAEGQHSEDATPPAPSGTSVGGRDDESDVLSYVDPNAPLSPEIGYFIDTEEEIDQQAALDYLLNLE